VHFFREECHTNNFFKVDLNGDGTIDFPEFLEMMKQKSNEADQVRCSSQSRNSFTRFYNRDVTGVDGFFLSSRQYG